MVNFPTPNLALYGFGQAPNPANVIPTTGAPGANLTELPLGTLAVDNAAAVIYALVSLSGGTATWASLGGGSSQVSTLTGDTGTATPSAGNIKIAGTANQITTTGSGHQVAISLPAAVTAPGSVTATTSLSATTTVTGGTGVTATTGDVTSTAGNLVASAAGKGISLNATTASGAASGPVVLNARAGQVTFTSVSIAAGADLTLTMTNSAISSSSTQLIYSLAGATSGSALSVKSITPGSGTVAWVITNGTGATTTTANIAITFLVVN